MKIGARAGEPHEVITSEQQQLIETNLPNHSALALRNALRRPDAAFQDVNVIANCPHPALPLPLRFAQGQRQGHPLPEGEGHSARALLPLGEEPALSDSERSEGGVEAWREAPDEGKDQIGN